ncbi:MAG: hypothetical protein LBI26_00135 [Holosporales bacterium]|jgi:O-antigen biosynthesis protein WbqV|nr:hypothetical protein [Holosporales bacterium]
MSLENKLSKFGKWLDNISKKCGDLLSVIFVIKNPKKKEMQSPVISTYSILIFDSFIAFLSIFISIHLRVGMDFLDYSPVYIIKNMLVFGLVSSSIFLFLQTYQSFWKYTSVEDIIPVFFSVILSNIIFFPLMMLMNQEDFLPYSVLVINVFVLAIILIIPRFITKILYNSRVNKQKRIDALTKIEERAIEIPEILLIGSPSSIDIFLNEVISNDDIQFNFEPVGILSLDQLDTGRAIKGVPILGSVRQVGYVMKTLAQDGVFPRQIMIAEKSIHEDMKKFLISYAQEKGILLMHVFHKYTFNTVME